jgi:hypothetical protein
MALRSGDGEPPPTESDARIQRGQPPGTERSPMIESIVLAKLSSGSSLE